MRRVEIAYLAHGETRSLREAELLVEMTRAEVARAGAEWDTYLRNALATLRNVGQKKPENAHWDWHRKSEAAAEEAIFLGVRCEERVQGMMILLPDQPARLNPGSSLLYVDYLATVPWNQVEYVVLPAFRSVGTALMLAAVRLSGELGYNRRLGLHALPNAEKFYRQNVGMTDLGVDENYLELRYFEMDSERAAQYAGET